MQTLVHSEKSREWKAGGMTKKDPPKKKRDLNSVLADIRRMKPDKYFVNAGTVRYKCLNSYCNETIRLSKRETKPQCYWCGSDNVKLLPAAKGDDE